MITDPNIDAPVQAAQAQKAATPGFLQGQKADTTDYLGRFSSFVNNLPTTQQLADKYSTELNLPTLRQNANSIQSTLVNLPHTYSQAARGTDVNANQLQRIIGQKTADLAPAATTANNALSSAENQLGQRIGYAQADRQLQLTPLQTEKDLLSERQAREATLYSQDNQHELDTLIARMNAGVTLSEGEKSRANQLALAEKQFNYTKELNKQQAELANGGSNQNRYITLGDGANLYDTQTGKIVAENAKNFAASSGSEWY